MLESKVGALTEAMDGAVRIALLESEVDELRRRDAERTAELAARERRIRLLEEALRILQANRYGASREKLTVAPGQSELFNEAETIAELNEVLGAEVNLKATPQREDKPATGVKPGRKAIAAHLPRVPVVHDLPESERQCACGSMLIEIGSEVSEQLDYVAPKIQVLQHVRKKYACPGCEQRLKTAALPAQILPKTNASPGMLAQLVTSKYVDALPLYRQEAIFARYGVSLPRATQAAWIIALAERVQPLINLMDERLRGSGYIRIDETPVQVINSEKAASSEHWMWVRLAGPPRQRIILFDYDASRSSEVAMRLLEGTHGVIQSDGYSAYDQVAKHYGLVHCGCLAHCPEPRFIWGAFNVTAEILGQRRSTTPDNNRSPIRWRRGRQASQAWATRRVCECAKGRSVPRNVRGHRASSVSLCLRSGLSSRYSHARGSRGSPLYRRPLAIRRPRNCAVAYAA
jgi:transposase